MSLRARRRHTHWRRAQMVAPQWCQGWWRLAHAVPSPNVDARPLPRDVSLVVVHSISLPPGVYGGAEVEAFFTNRLDLKAHPYYERLHDVRVSAHFFVRRTGAVVQFASCDARAWHAGVSSWAGRARCNDFSIGIELEGLEGTAFERAQYVALATLLTALRDVYPVAAVVGHEHIAPGRKRDPGSAFEWRQLWSRTRWPRRLFDHALHAAAQAVAPSPMVNLGTTKPIA